MVLNIKENSTSSSNEGVAPLRSIVNREVVNFRGQVVGNIDDIVIDVKTGSIEGVLVKTSHQVTKLPWRALEYNRSKGAFELQAQQGRNV